MCYLFILWSRFIALTELANEKKWQGVSVAVASCCDVPPWAFELLGKFEFGPKKTKMNESWTFFKRILLPWFKSPLKNPPFSSFPSRFEYH